MGLEKVKVGDRLTVCPHSYGHTPQPYKFVTAVKVTKTSVTDSEGERWTMAGRRWGNSGAWSGALCRPFENSDENDNKMLLAEQAETWNRNRLLGVKWRTVDVAVIDECIAVLEKHHIK